MKDFGAKNFIRSETIRKTKATIQNITIMIP